MRGIRTTRDRTEQYTEARGQSIINMGGAVLITTLFLLLFLLLLPFFLLLLYPISVRCSNPRKGLWEPSILWKPFCVHSRVLRGSLLHVPTAISIPHSTAFIKRQRLSSAHLCTDLKSLPTWHRAVTQTSEANRPVNTPMRKSPYLLNWNCILQRLHRKCVSKVWK